MKDALRKETGSKFPLKITLANGEVMVRYVRGFADQKSNILLISETFHSLALKIVEVKDIRSLEYASENAEGSWKVLRAGWRKKNGPIAFYLGFICLIFHLHPSVS